LIIMRHAKSDWETDAPTDHARPLNRRGRRDAPRIAKRIAQLGWQPDIVVSSDSQRTRETYQLMTDHFSPDVDLRFLDSLYHAGPHELADVLQQLPDAAVTVLALGHNPGWSEVVYWLTKNSVSMTTANAALCHVPANSWPAALQLAGSWQLDEVLRPKEL